MLELSNFKRVSKVDFKTAHPGAGLENYKSGLPDHSDAHGKFGFFF
jgi:hypothetical protein